MLEFEVKQAEHYDKIIDYYGCHSNDQTSISYRNMFILNPLFAGLELSGKKILDAMCGTGEATSYLLGKGGIVTALDISSAVINAYKKRWPSCEAICDSIFSSNLPQDFFITC